jgi:hypothetical protein
MSVKLRIIKQIKAIANEHNITLAPLSKDLALFESGLDSLCLAILIVRLEDEFGFDPFNGPNHFVPETFGDFVRAYDSHNRMCKTASSEECDLAFGSLPNPR